MGGLLKKGGRSTPLTPHSDANAVTKTISTCMKLFHQVAIGFIWCYPFLHIILFCVWCMIMSYIIALNLYISFLFRVNHQYWIYSYSQILSLPCLFTGHADRKVLLSSMKIITGFGNFKNWKLQLTTRMWFTFHWLSAYCQNLLPVRDKPRALHIIIRRYFDVRHVEWHGTVSKLTVQQKVSNILPRIIKLP